MFRKLHIIGCDRDMSIENIEEWFYRMENLREADIPILMYKNKMYTPREIYQHAMAGDDIYKGIIRKYPNLDPVSLPVELLKQRILEKYREGLLTTIYLLRYPYVLTPEQQIQEIEADTQIGRELLEAEEKLVQELTR